MVRKIIRRVRVVEFARWFFRTSVPAGIIGKRFQKSVPAKVRPVQWRYKYFRVSSLQEKEITQSKFSRCPDDQIGDPGDPRFADKERTLPRKEVAESGWACAYCATAFNTS